MVLWRPSITYSSLVLLLVLSGIISVTFCRLEEISRHRLLLSPPGGLVVLGNLLDRSFFALFLVSFACISGARETRPSSMPFPWTPSRSSAVFGTTFTLLFGPGLIGVPLALGLRWSRQSYPFPWPLLILGKGLAELSPLVSVLSVFSWFWFFFGFVIGLVASLF